MKQTRGAAGMSGEAEDDNFQVVPVESISEYKKLLVFQVEAADYRPGNAFLVLVCPVLFR